ncbi:MAG: 16S rRNA (cytosine(1402)-N(4))-methyltransferase RsmH [Clostridiales bacterium]|jgi:16S rRNA (cytosine1402-N4)-methyltransferase|nr:16S rRNA (cytosine(1402)-N(4))-methyltransferase RsmH [Clostridiales bacterium]
MFHVPVLLEQVLSMLNVRQGGLYFDGTLGGGGHSKAILQVQNTNVIACDLDLEAIKFASNTLQEYILSERFTCIKSNFKDIGFHFDRLGIEKLDGALLDLGVSSHQIDSINRGFSYNKKAQLDMRMDTSSELTAHNIVNNYSVEQLIHILRDYGEERFANKIANKIADTRQVCSIDTTQQLVDIIRQCIPYHLSNGHPAKKTFQAIRIAVNGELDGLDICLRYLADKLCKGARLCVISFHSLEDRIVKNCFNDLAQGCICDKRLPVCVCNNVAKVKVMPKYKASKSELVANKRAKSAILRTCEKIN